MVKSKLSTTKKSKTTTFSRVFHPKKIDNFLGKSKLIFLTKSEDLEQWFFLKLPFFPHFYPTFFPIFLPYFYFPIFFFLHFGSYTKEKINLYFANSLFVNS